MKLCCYILAIQTLNFFLPPWKHTNNPEIPHQYGILNFQHYQDFAAIERFTYKFLSLSHLCSNWNPHHLWPAPLLWLPNWSCYLVSCSPQSILLIYTGVIYYNINLTMQFPFSQSCYCSSATVLKFSNHSSSHSQHSTGTNQLKLWYFSTQLTSSLWKATYPFIQHIFISCLLCKT